MTSALPGTTDDLPPYPGRGLVIGSLASGHPFWLYFVTGRWNAALRWVSTAQSPSSPCTAPPTMSSSTTSLPAR